MEKLQNLDFKDQRFRKKQDALLESAFALTQFQYALAIVLLNGGNINDEQRKQLNECEQIFFAAKGAFLESTHGLGVDVTDFNADDVMEWVRPKI